MRFGVQAWMERQVPEPALCSFHENSGHARRPSTHGQSTVPRQLDALFRQDRTPGNQVDWLLGNRHACTLGTTESLDFGHRPEAKVLPCVEAAALPWRGVGPACQYNLL